MKKSILSLLIFSFILCGCKNTTPLSNKEFCLDTIIQITLYDSSSKNILNNCFDLCKKYERIFSANNKKSELYKINPVSYTHLDVYKRQARCKSPFPSSSIST